MGLGLGGWCTFDQVQSLLAMWAFMRGETPRIWLFDPKTGRRATVLIPLRTRWPAALTAVGTVTAWGRVNIAPVLARLAEPPRERQR